jgi:hypothetical protein
MIKLVICALVVGAALIAVGAIPAAQAQSEAMSAGRTLDGGMADGGMDGGADGGAHAQPDQSGGGYRP